MRKENPSSIRSKMMLSKALLELMKSEPYDKITISEIADRALLSRRTFYSHFKAKEDIIKYYVTTIYKEYFSYLKHIEVTTPEELSLHFFNFFKRYSKELYLMNVHGITYYIGVFDELFNQEPELYSVIELQRLPIEYSIYEIAFYTGAVINLLLKWINNDFKESPEEMAQLLSKMYYYK